MPDHDQRNVLHVGAPARPGDPEVTQATVDAVAARITAAGGALTIAALPGVFATGSVDVGFAVDGGGVCSLLSSAVAESSADRSFSCPLWT